MGEHPKTSRESNLGWSENDANVISSDECENIRRRVLVWRISLNRQQASECHDYLQRGDSFCRPGKAAFR